MRTAKGFILTSVLIFLIPIACFCRECENWQTVHPEWIFCDDFEDGTAMVRQGRYFEHDNNGGDFVIVEGVGLRGSRGMKVV